MQYGYQKSHANMITNHILAVADEKAFMDKSKLAKYLSLFNYIGSANIHRQILDYWSVKMKLSGDDEAGSGAKK